MGDNFVFATAVLLYKGVICLENGEKMMFYSC